MNTISPKRLPNIKLTVAKFKRATMNVDLTDETALDELIILSAEASKLSRRLKSLAYDIDQDRI